jgi:uncharacterized protein
LHAFPSAADVDQTLTELAARELVERLPKRPGEREERWRQLLGADPDSSVPRHQPAPPEAGTPRRDDLERRIAALEARLDAAGL